MDPMAVTFAETTPQTERYEPSQKFRDREEERRQELQALKALLLQKHKRSVKTDTVVEVATVISESKLAKKKKKEKDAAAAKTSTEAAEVKASTTSNKSMDTTTKNSILASKKSNTTSNNKKQSLTLKQHRLLLSLRKDKGSKKSFRNTPQGKFLAGVQMIASELLFACTPTYFEEDEKEEDAEEADDHHLMVCSALEKTCGGKQGVALADEEEDGIPIPDKEDVTIDSKKPKEISIDFAPKFKKNALENQNRSLDDNTTFTTLDENSLFKLKQKKVKKGKTKKPDPYALDSNSIVTGSGSESGAKENGGGSFGNAGNKNHPFAVSSVDAYDAMKQKNATTKTSTRLIGKATAESPILLLSDSVEHLILEGGSVKSGTTSSKQEDSTVHDDVLRLLSSSAAEEEERMYPQKKSSKKNKKAALLIEHRDDTSGGDDEYFGATTNETDDDKGDVPTTDDDLDDTTDDDTADYQDMEEKMLMQVRLASQLRKRRQLHKKLQKAKQQQREQHIQEQLVLQAHENRDDVEQVRDSSGVVDSDRHNLSNHTHLTGATNKIHNTSTNKNVVVEAVNKEGGHDDMVEKAENTVEDSTMYYPKDDPAETTTPLDAEELYNQTYRQEKRRKDLEEMKSILSKDMTTTAIGSRSYYGLHESPGNIFDLQRASNQRTLQALRAQHFDVVRLQLEEENDIYTSRLG